MSWSLAVRRAPDALLDCVVIVFGLWTICCHATVLSHGTGHALLTTAATTFAVATVGFIAVGYHRRRRGPRPETPSHDSHCGVPVPLSIVGLVGAALVLGTWQLWQDGWTFWLACLLFVLAGTGLVLGKSLPDDLGVPEQAPSTLAASALGALGVVGMLATALAVQSNTDDVLYVALGVALADHPEYELFTRDTLHGGAMGLFRPYAVHSYELAAGALGRLTSLEVLSIMHLGFAPFAGLLTAFAWGRLFRILDPARWVGLTAIVVSWYVFDATTPNSVPGHAFLRLFQGKSILLTVALPLISANAIAFVLRPSVRRWCLLALSTICGIGLSSTGLWLALLVVLTALFVPMTLRRSFFGAAAWGVASLAYPIGLALWVRSGMQSEPSDTVASAASSLLVGPEAMASTMSGYFYHLGTFGSLKIAYAYVACLVCAWPLARTLLLRRYLLAFSLGGFAILINPHLASLVAQNITGAATKSRILWYLPFAAAFATCLGCVLPTSWNTGRASAGAAVTLLALCSFYQAIPLYSTFDYSQRAPALKVHPTGYEVARYLVEELDEESSVLAPVEVSLVLPMLRHHPYTLVTKPRFLDPAQRARFGMRKIVDGRISPMWGKRRSKFIKGLEHYGVSGVVLTDRAASVPGMLETLQLGGFGEARRFRDLHVWLRPAPRLSPRGS